MKHRKDRFYWPNFTLQDLPFLKQMEDRPGMSPSFALLCYRNRDTPMQYKNQHTVPQSYLSVWCDHETPAGQRPMFGCGRRMGIALGVKHRSISFGRRTFTR